MAIHPPITSISRGSARSWIASLTDSQIARMERVELLEVIQIYQSPDGSFRAQDDHRQFLSRPELERLVFLVRSHCQRVCAG